MLVFGDRNIVAWNIAQGINVEGTANILDGNILGAYLNFMKTGNFYGNNRISGALSGASGQTDWGGNLTF
jgi:hypothetical protein